MVPLFPLPTHSTGTAFNCRAAPPNDQCDWAIRNLRGRPRQRRTTSTLGQGSLHSSSTEVGGRHVDWRAS
uniref:Uncharacterized protein n=1 Tax=Plectus sambesii TaxID=2011161 RepID=A0A914WL19_9BILA